MLNNGEGQTVVLLSGLCAFTRVLSGTFVILLRLIHFAPTLKSDNTCLKLTNLMDKSLKGANNTCGPIFRDSFDGV